jgi:hypothetical protein
MHLMAGAVRPAPVWSGSFRPNQEGKEVSVMRIFKHKGMSAVSWWTPTNGMNTAPPIGRMK